MKKVLSLVLAAAMTFGMSAVAFAATVDSSNLESALGDSAYYIGGSKGGSGEYDVSGQVANGGIDLGTEIRAGDKYIVDAYGRFYDSASLYVEGGKNYYLQLGVDNNDIATYHSTGDFSRNKITLKKKISKGGELIKDPELKNKTQTNVPAGTGATAGTVKSMKYCVLQIEFKDPIVSVKEKEFDFTVFLAKSGSKLTETEIQVTGFHNNEQIDVDEDDEVNLSDGQYAKALSYTKGILVDTGNGLFIRTNMFTDQKYYAKSEQNEPSNADEDILAKYPEIDNIYTLYSINMKSASNVVTFDIDDKYYVYNQDGKYIGMTTDKLPMANKFYLATKKIDMDNGDVAEAPDDTDGNAAVDVDSPSTGGDDVAVNVNDNPGTGANGFVNVAVVAGMVALAAGAVSMKK